MHGFLVEQFGGTEVMQWRELGPLVPGPRQVLVEVRASGVNFAETRMRAGTYSGQELPFVMGMDGKIVMYGSTGGRQVCFNLNIGVRNLALMSMSISTSECFLTYTMPRFRELALPLFADGAFKAPVGPVLPLSDVVRAHQLVDERNHFGKIILTV